MSKFGLLKTLTLEFLGEAWKDCYLKFSALTYRDFKTMVNFNVNNPKARIQASDETIRILSEHFVEGLGVNEKGTEIKITKEDLEDLPVEVITRALSFLLEAPAVTSSSP